MCTMFVSFLLLLVHGTATRNWHRDSDSLLKLSANGAELRRPESSAPAEGEVRDHHEETNCITFTKSHAIGHVPSFCAVTHRKLGGGGNSDLYLGYVPKQIGYPSMQVALKFPKTRDLIEEEKFKNEITILKEMQISMYVVHLFGYNIKEEAIAMEMLAGGSLWEKRGQGFFPLSLRNAGQVMRQVVHAVADCHDNDVAHRDLKEEQFVFEKPINESNSDTWNTRLKLVDFGESIQLLGIAAMLQPRLGSGWSEKVGSLPYLSPEVAWNGVLYGTPPKTFSVYAPDVWAVGVIAFQITTGKIFLEELVNQVERKKPLEKRKQLSLNKPALSLMSRLVDATNRDIDIVLCTSVVQPAIRDFIWACLKVLPSKRSSAKVLLQHPWLSGAELGILEKSKLTLGFDQCSRMGVKANTH